MLPLFSSSSSSSSSSSLFVFILSVCIFTLSLCSFSVLSPVSAYYDYQYVYPAVNSVAWSLPRLNIGMTQPLAGALSLSGLAALETAILMVDTANTRGGILFNQSRHAVTLTYLSDESSKDLAFEVYAKYANNASIQLLLSSHNTDLNIAALTSLEPLNKTLFSMGSSSNTVCKGKQN